MLVILFNKQAVEVNMEEATKAIDKLKHTIYSEGYKMCNVFNMDETGLLYKFISSQTYLIGGKVRNQ